ncbi:hypothetical protein ATL41_0457 [Flavimobilis soli]|jgi:hypothetical protein|uniref:Primosomal protein n=1 Tax=Flavimobilis soli TaxID=442709 RepID=A0A2A9EB28_9MICO|nr:primosomal protein [Flavimobilis soli]PFG35761.1 hypothetical protein ATL41_0457 [Flavimobilis soli]
MTVEPRAALDRLVAAFEAHLSAIVGRRGDDDPAVDEAYYVLADAFDVYDEAIASTYGEALPFYVAEEDDEDDDDDEDDEDDLDDEDLDDIDEDDLDDDELEGLSEDEVEELAKRER